MPNDKSAISPMGIFSLSVASNTPINAGLLANIPPSIMLILVPSPNSFLKEKVWGGKYTGAEALDIATW
ncbi:hypothetical protein D3C80_1909320 [compost metagenome]